MEKLIARLFMLVIVKKLRAADEFKLRHINDIYSKINLVKNK